MLNLIKNEWIKIFRQKGTLVMIAFLLVVTMGFAGITKYNESKTSTVKSDWKQELAKDNEGMEQDLSEVGMVTPSYREHVEGKMAINEYRIQHDLPPASTYDGLSFIEDSASLIHFAGLLVMIVAAGIVANDFTWGTIKVLLTKPYHRWKVLLAKYATVNLFLVLILAILFICSGLAGAILFGMGSDASEVRLVYANGLVQEQSQWFYLVKLYVLNSLNIFLLATMAFMISAVFRASGLAIGITIFLLLTGDTITNLLASQFDWAKYSLFANTNLMQYMDGMPLVDGMTLTFSIVMIIIYFSIFHFMAFWFFTKRDIAS